MPQRRKAGRQVVSRPYVDILGGVGKVCLGVRFIAVLEVFNSLPQYWVLVGCFIVSLQWDITQKFIIVPKG
jgi:hypothetical protein